MLNIKNICGRCGKQSVAWGNKVPLCGECWIRKRYPSKTKQEEIIRKKFGRREKYWKKVNI